MIGEALRKRITPFHRGVRFALKTASHAVMFTDIKGFTARTSRQTRAENARLLRRHDALLLPVIAGFGGRRVKTIGDAFLVVFDSATRALACGAAIQDRLALFNAQVPPEERIEIRVAINVGEVHLARSDVHGEAVNIAARVEKHTEAGEVRFTEAVHLVADRTAIDVEELGPHALRGLPEPVRLYRLRRVAEGALPYGGGALASLGLPPPDPLVLGRRRRSLRLGAIAAVLVALVAALVLWALLNREDPAEEIRALVEAGAVDEADRRLQALGPTVLDEGIRAFLEGLVAQGRDDAGRAVQRYAAAAILDERVGRRHAVPQLATLLEHDECAVRSAAARTLGEIGTADARPALQALAEREPASQGFFQRLRLGGCNAGDAARQALGALDRLEAGESRLTR